MLYGGILVARSGLGNCEPKCGRKRTHYCRNWKGIRKSSILIPLFNGWGDWALNALPKSHSSLVVGSGPWFQCNAFLLYHEDKLPNFAWTGTALRFLNDAKWAGWWGGRSSLFGTRKCLSLRLHNHLLKNVWVNASPWTVSGEIGKDPKVESSYTFLLWRQIVLINWTQSPGWGHSQSDFTAAHVVSEEDKYHQWNGS